MPLTRRNEAAILAFKVNEKEKEERKRRKRQKIGWRQIGARKREPLHVVDQIVVDNL